MSTPPLSPSSAQSPPAQTSSPRSTRRKQPQPAELSKPNESWFLILVNAFKSNYEQTLTYRESELYSWIMQAYPYYRHDMHTMQTSVKTTLSSYECFRQNGRSTWTFIPKRALTHLESLKSAEGRLTDEGSDDEDEDVDEDALVGEDEEMDEDLDPDEVEISQQSQYSHQQQHVLEPQDYTEFNKSYFDDSPSNSGGRPFVDRRIDLMDADSPTLSAEEIQRFKQEHSGALSRRLKRKTSGGHLHRPRTRSPTAGLQDECSMSMEAWCNLLVQMFEASPKQKTIREIFAWVHDNYPIYQNAPGDAWQKDLTAALESNPLFKPMGRGRWQMATQAPSTQPAFALNGVPATADGPETSPIIRDEEDSGTDSPSVTEDEDWKAIGSKKLLSNHSFRRYSIATDTVQKNPYKPGSETTTGSTLHPSSATTTDSTTTIPTTAGAAILTETTPGGKLLPTDRPANYTGGRRFSSYHQPTPKNSPPLAPMSSGLPPVAELSTQIRLALGEEAEEGEDPSKKYMASLRSIIPTAAMAQQSLELEGMEPEQASAYPNTNATTPQPNLDHPAIVVQGPGGEDDAARSRSTEPYGDHDLSDPHGGSTSPPVALSSSAGSEASAGVPMSEPEPSGDGTATKEARLEQEIEVPNREDLASDQMDAIAALALLCGGGV
ncbi:hypothetical protein BGW38_006957 [Lunasporangiospora selenospora]|uniref:Fork-head domain-containing protein n=1 Tax=Lunasporangiospora selenospora TaxID=979761 RepID=A0A9P6KGX7_9FUNG|nr:hypothetical protein BGW38_006957 [Lunasporangiospora selenospora]